MYAVSIRECTMNDKADENYYSPSQKNTYFNIIRKQFFLYYWKKKSLKQKKSIKIGHDK